MNLRIRQWLSGLPTITAIHFPDSRRVTSKGWVDWTFLGPNGVLFIELKGRDDRLSPDQRKIGRLLTINNHHWQVWGPLDMRFGGLAELELRAIA